MNVDEETVRKLAELAEIDLSAEEFARMQSDLGKILDYVAKLEQLDTRDVTPTANAFDLATPFREDRADHVIDVAEALRNAPEHDSHAVVVPKVVE